YPVYPYISCLTHVYPSNTPFIPFCILFTCLPYNTVYLVSPYISCVPMLTLYTLYPYISCVPMFTLVILCFPYTPIYPVYPCLP
ncbi:unnamed protein product, partial [Porites lobata]